MKVSGLQKIEEFANYNRKFSYIDLNITHEILKNIIFKLNDKDIDKVTRNVELLHKLY